MKKRNKQLIIENQKYDAKANMCLALAVAILLLILLGNLLSFIPDQLDKQYIKENYIKDVSEFAAEDSEKLQYILLTICFPIFYIFAYKIIEKFRKNQKYSKNIFIIFSCLNLLLIILGICLIVIFGENEPIFRCIKSAYWGVLGGIILLILYQKFIKKRKWINRITYVITALFIAILSFLYINNSFEQSSQLAHHFDAYYYPILKISSGLTPYVDFTPLYGCYSYIYVLLQNIFQQDSLLFFSIINCILVAITMTNFAIVTNKAIKNKIISFLVILGIGLWLVMFMITDTQQVYLQYMPHRTLWISIILLWITIYLRKREKKLLLEVIGYFISSFALFWNLETGLVVLLIWSGFLLYQVLFFHSIKDKKTYVEITKIIFLAILSFFLTWIMVMIIGYMRTGEITSVYKMIASQTTFYRHRLLYDKNEVVASMDIINI